MNDRKKVLIVNGQYAPGYKGGGPIQSCINMVENLYEFYDFYVLCADCDYKEEEPYKEVVINNWNQVGHARVFYANSEAQSIKGLKKVLNEIEYDVLYLNGFFSPIFTIRPLLLRRLGKLREAKIILTPRGDFTGGCENKKVKKYSYIFFAKLFGIYNNLVWHATSEIEDKDIRNRFSGADTFIVPNLPIKFRSKVPITTKKVGELRLVFVSRIFPKKNIKYALEVLKEIKEGNIIFDIYGPMEDKEYWVDCEDVIRDLPLNVRVKYCGEVPHDEIPNVFEKYHAFFFPTLGENYGHVIVEAMMNNCLCILSKGVTPWDDYIEALDIGAELSDKERFICILKKLIKCDSDQFYEKLMFTQKYIMNKNKPDEYVMMYRKLLG